MADALAVRSIRDRLTQPDGIRAAAFGILRSICALVNNEPVSVGEVDPKVQELVLRALEHRDEFGPAVVILDGLVRRLGLFPYLDPAELGLADTIAYEYHRPTNMGADDVIFHRAQGEVYRSLLAGENVILSAPTSFGKSLIIDAIVATGKFTHIAIVVPTIALIDETRRRLARRFGQQYRVITHPSQERGTPELLVMTQERLLDVKPLAPIDFFVIDEFYKLQPRQEDTDRSLVLNEAFYRLHKTGAQFYLLGPNIDSVGNLPTRITCRFIKTDYKTVVSQLHRVDPKDDDVEQLVQLCKELHEPTLIFCRSPQRVRNVTHALLEGGLGVTQPNLSEAVAWIGEQYHPDWLFAKALGKGIGMHHGQLPRTLSQFVVKAFNDGNVRFLVCTSTLIEGVNTKAKNVVVLDNKIAKRKYDFFTYNNIAGRSGRMFEHFVGNVYVFRDPPAENLPLIDVPVFTQPDDAPESLLIQIDEADLGVKARERVGDLLQADELGVDVLKDSRGVDPRSLVRLSQAMREHVNDWAPRLSWTGQPTNAQLQLVCGLIWDYLVPGRQMRAGVISGPQLAFRIERLRQSGGGVGLLQKAIQDSATPGDVVESTIEFLRYWANFNFPKYLLAVDRVQRSTLTKLGRAPGNYAYFTGLVENWFLDPAIMALDEYGVPIQVGQKLQTVLQPGGNLDVAIARLRSLNVSQLQLTSFEKELVKDAIANL